MNDHEQEYEQENEGYQVTGFEKLDETQTLIRSLLSVSLTEEPSSDADKTESNQLLALHQIVS